MAVKADAESFPRKQVREILRAAARLLMLLIVAAVLVGVSAGISIGDRGALTLLEQVGYQDVEVHVSGYSVPFVGKCEPWDLRKFVLSATNPEGDRQELIVCDGWHRDPYIVDDGSQMSPP